MHLYRVRKERPLHCGLWKAWCCWQFSIVGGFTAQGLYQLIPDIHLLISLKDEDLDFSDHFTFPGVLCWISPWVLFSFLSMLFLVRRKVNSVPARAAELSLSTWLYCHRFWQHIPPVFTAGSSVCKYIQSTGAVTGSWVSIVDLLSLTDVTNCGEIFCVFVCKSLPCLQISLSILHNLADNYYNQLLGSISCCVVILFSSAAVKEQQFLSLCVLFMSGC